MKEVDQYRNLSELFNRRLKPGARHVDLRSSLVRIELQCRGTLVKWSDFLSERNEMSPTNF